MLGEASVDPESEETATHVPEGRATESWPAPADLMRGLEGRLDPDKRFLIYSAGGFALRTFEIKTGSRAYIGRAHSNDLTLVGPKVSRRHALLDADGDKPAVLISNLASTHGVYVNGEKVDSHELRDKDVIGIGDFTLIYVDPS